MNEFEIAKLELKEGDFLVFRFLGDIDIDAVECLYESLASVLPKNITALILDGNNVELSVVNKE